MKKNLFIILLMIGLMMSCNWEFNHQIENATFETPIVKSYQKSGSFANKAMTSLSGIAIHDGKTWGHNDSFSCIQVLLLQSGKENQNLSFTIRNAILLDWEDMTSDGDSLYIGDIGDNLRCRQEYAVYKIDFPVSWDQKKLVAQKYPYCYPNGFQVNSEALFQVLGHLYVMTKEEGQTAVFRLPMTNSCKEAEYLFSLPTQDYVTGAAANYSTSELAVLTQTDIKLYPFETRGDGFQVDPKNFKMLKYQLKDQKKGEKGQCEAIDFINNEKIRIATEGGDYYDILIKDFTNIQAK